MKLDSHTSRVEAKLEVECWRRRRVLPYGAGRIPYLLPMRVELVAMKFEERRRKTQGYYAYKWKDKDRQQAERVAWRQLFWVAQIAARYD